MPDPQLHEGVYSVSGAAISRSWVQIGEHTYIARSLGLGAWYPGEMIIIGRWCSIADQVVILTGGGHRTDIASTYPMDSAMAASEERRPPERSRSSGAGLTPTVIPALRQMAAFLRWRAVTRTYRTSRNTTIGNDVWIGFRSTVLGGAQIGDGAVVAAGSVVFSDVPPFAVVAGNPAQVVRYRFSRKTAERLQRIAWWNWPEEKVRENLEWFYKPAAEFVERFDSGGVPNG